MFAAMASVALVSCVKNEPTVQVAEQDEISFADPIMAPSVKSVFELKKFPTDKTFKVWAAFTQETAASSDLDQKWGTYEYMEDVEVSYNVGKTAWMATTGKYYWPTNGYLTFVAYGPSTAKVSAQDVTGTGLGLTYAVSANADEDFLVSEVAYDRKKTDNNVATGWNGENDYQGAEIVFKHALSSIVFKIKSGVYGDGDRTGADKTLPYTDLRVTKVELLNVQNKGVFNQAMTSWENEQMVDDKDDVNLEKGWTLAPDSAESDYVAYEATDTDKGLVLTGDLQLIHDKTVDNEDTDSLALTHLIVLPQEIAPASAAPATDGVILKITYDLRNSNMADDTWITGQVALRNLNLNPLANKGVTEWLRGYRYTYNVTLTLDEITFDPEVSAWTDYDTGFDTNDITPDYN